MRVGQDVLGQNIVSGFSENLRHSNSQGVEFLLVELDTALTFMDVAETTGIEATVERNHKNARIAYDTVLRLMPTVQLDARQKKILKTKLERLRLRLEGAGQL